MEVFLHKKEAFTHKTALKFPLHHAPQTHLHARLTPRITPKKPVYLPSDALTGRRPYISSNSGKLPQISLDFPSFPSPCYILR